MDAHAPIGDVMRYLMYSRSYGDHNLARTLYGQIPTEVRRQITSLDYTKAEKKCPQGIAIGQLMREATIELT